MFKQWIKDQHEMVTSVAEEIPERSNRVVFYTTFWAAIVVMPLAALWLVAWPFKKIVRKAF